MVRVMKHTKFGHDKMLPEKLSVNPKVRLLEFKNVLPADDVMFFSHLHQSWPPVMGCSTYLPTAETRS